VVVKMQPYYKPEILVLEGEEAVQVLNEYVKELMEGQAEELTKEQAKVMIKLAKGLISTIEEEAQNQVRTEKTQLLPNLKNIIKNRVSQTLQKIPKPSLPEKLDSAIISHNPLPLSHEVRW